MGKITKFFLYFATLEGLTRAIITPSAARDATDRETQPPRLIRETSR